MTALAKDRAAITTVGPNDGGGVVLEYTMADADIIYRGAFVSLNAGEVEPGNANAAKEVIGVSIEQKDNTADGEKIRVLVAPRIRHVLASVAVASIGAKVFASDDQTLTLVTTSNSKVGWLVAVPETGIAIVQISHPGQNVD